tara:strand:- start:620 stop:1129 length:510 start_codon:yes stop_codon:yes gene_type:complete
MNISSNELKMAVLKACRGVGLPIAQAQDVAAAMAPSPWALKQLLTQLAKPMRTASFDFSAGLEVKNAYILRDFWVCVDAAYLAVPWVCLRGVIPCNVTEALAHYGGVSIVMQGADLLVRVEERAMLQPVRCEVDPDEWHELGLYAALTYVPETNASRLVGAGAGLNDND